MIWWWWYDVGRSEEWLGLKSKKLRKFVGDEWKKMKFLDNFMLKYCTSWRCMWEEEIFTGLGGLIFWAFEILNCNVFVVFSENYFMNRREFSFCRVPSHREHRRPYIQTSRNGNCYVIVTHYSKCLLLLFLVVILVATTTIRPAPRRRWREVVYREDRIVWRKGNPKIILIECHQWMKAINNSNRCRCAFHNPSNR